MRIGDTLYFDHQATTPPDARVLSEMAPFLGDLFGNPHAVDHAAGWRAAGVVNDAATKIAQLVGADPDEVIFTSGATEANNLALLGIGRRAANGHRNRILISSVEHKSNIACARMLRENHDYKIEYIPVETDGTIKLDYLDESMNDDVLLVCAMAVNNEIGTIQPIEEISKIAAFHGALLHCDAAQAPCAISIEGLTQHADLVSLSSHKMYGPPGIGALVVRRDLHHRIEPVIYGGGQQGGLRSGTVPAALCVGMGAAASILLEDSAMTERDRIRKLRDSFVDRLQQIVPDAILNGPSVEIRHPGNANVRFSKRSAHTLLGALQPHLAASTGSACTSGIPEPSHVLRAVGLSEPDAEASVRFSIGRHTTVDDVVVAIDLIKEAILRTGELDGVQAS